LDIIIKRTPEDHLLPSVYRKSTHWDRYPNYRSEHPYTPISE